MYNPDRSNVIGSGSPRCAGEVRCYVNPTLLELLTRKSPLWMCERHVKWRDLDEGEPLMSWELASCPVEIVLDAMLAAGVPVTSTSVHVVTDELLKRDVVFPVVVEDSK